MNCLKCIYKCDDGEKVEHSIGCLGCVNFDLSQKERRTKSFDDMAEGCPAAGEGWRCGLLRKRCSEENCMTWHFIKQLKED